jgi:hypothetical protein
LRRARLLILSHAQDAPEVDLHCYVNEASDILQGKRGSLTMVINLKLCMIHTKFENLGR